MSFVKPSYAVDNVQQLADLTENQATLVKQTFDKTGSDTKDFLNAHMDELDATIYTKTEINNLDSDNVKLTGNQTIADVKTFLNSPVIPIAINGNNPIRKDTYDTKNASQDSAINLRSLDNAVVHITGNETVNGVKTFGSSPIIPTPTTNLQASTKGYVDTTVAGVVLGQVSDNSLTEIKMANEMKKDIVGGVLGFDAYTPSDILTKLKTVDGVGSGLDADVLCGKTVDITGLANNDILGFDEDNNKWVVKKPDFAIFRTMTAIIDLANSNPATSVTYADDAGLVPGSAAWDDFFGHKPCLFKAGAVVGYLNPNNFAQFADGSAADITSGNAGDVMIEFPRRGLSITTVGNLVTIKMTDNPNNPAFEYNAHTRGITAKDKFYLGAYKGNNVSSKLRSLSGKTPTTSQTIGTFRTQAQANGADYEQSGFYQLTFRQCMYILKYRHLNSQTALGRGYVDGNSAKINTGGTNAKGMDFGETTGKLQMKLFGIEDFWGNTYEWIDGIVTDASRNMLTANSSFNDTGSGYTNNGQGATADIGSHMSKPQGGTKTGFIAKEVSGSETTYFCDSTHLSASCVAYCGGTWAAASSAGTFRLGVDDTASGSYASIAARLMYL